jgi:AcrR family transcriptional regulator
MKTSSKTHTPSAIPARFARTKALVSKKAAAPAAAAAKPRATYHHGDLRAQMIVSARAIIETEGLAALSLRSAAKHAGVSPAAPLHHFREKEGLLAAVATEGFAELLDNRHRKQRGVTDPEQRLRIVITEYVRYAINNRGMFHLMFGPQIADKATYPDLLEVAHTSYDMLSGAVVALLPAGRLDALQTEAIVRCVWSASHGLATLLAEQTQIPRKAAPLSHQAWLDAVVRFAIQGVRNADTGNFSAS